MPQKERQNVPEYNKLLDGIGWKEIDPRIYGKKIVKRYVGLIPCTICQKQIVVKKDSLRKIMREYYNRNGSMDGYTYKCSYCAPRQKGEKSHRWKGGRSKNHGYDRIHISLVDPKYHYLCKDGNYIYLHRLYAAMAQEQKLNKYTHVHHKDGNKLNNNIENLEVIDNATHCLITKLTNQINQQNIIIKELVTLLCMQKEIKNG